MIDAQGSSPEVRAIAEAVQGLEYPSESDTPFDVFLWKAAPGRSPRDEVAARTPAGRPARVEEVTVKRFFGDLEGTEQAKRFEELRRVLESRLGSLSVFRVDAGVAEVGIHIVGRTAAGDWAGVHTVSVET